MIRRYTFHIIFSILCFTVAQAQINNRKFYHITRDNGLSQSTVNCIVKGSNGFMWFGTNDGLNKYDGYNFTCYRYDEKDPNSIGLGRINVLFVDRKGRLWAGTDQGGLNLYDQKMDNFKRINAINRFNPGINNNITDISETTQGNLWVATDGKGLFQMDPETFEIIPVETQKIPEVNCLEYTDKSDLLLGTPNGLYRIEHGNKKYGFLLPELISEFEGISVIALYTDTKGLIWVGTYGKGAFTLNLDSHQVEEYSTHCDNKNHRLTHDIIRDFIEDTDSNLIIATGGGGLNILHRNTGTIERIFHKLNYQYSLNTNIIYTLYLDDIGNLWIGTYNGGVNILFKAKDKFGQIKSYGAEDDLSNNAVLAIIEAPNGKLFIGTDGGGLDIYDPSTDHFVHHIHDPHNSNSLSSNVVKSLYLDDNGILWIGTYNGGLNVYNIRTNTYKHYIYEQGVANRLTQNDVWDIVKDREGHIWIATLGGGLNMFDPEKNRFRIFLHDPDNPNSISDNVISSLLIDSKGNLWVGTEFGGICKLTDLNTGSFKAYNRSVNIESISSNQISTLYEDSQGNIWAGTIGGGLNLYTEAEDRFISYTEADGLANNLVLAILEDNQGNLWISTNNGLSKFINGTYHPAVSRFLNFNKNDGLQSNEFSSQAAFKTKEGILYFGGINGISYFNPMHIIYNNHVPPVVITDFKIFNRSVDVLEKNSPLKQNISQTKEIKLTHEQSVITFEFAALDFTVPSENQYKYILEGFEEQWNDVGNKRTATYTNLNPGTYTFRVIGSNNDDIWNMKGTSIRLIIQPPFYKTWGFRIAIVILILLGIYGFYRYKLHSLERHKKTLKKLVNERTSELLDLNTILGKRNQEVQDQREELVIQKENLERINKELERNQLKIGEQNAELERHRHNLEELVKQRTQELEKARLKAEESDRLKTSFLSNMSHEIRTPLNAIVGFSSLLAEEDLNEKEKDEFLAQINLNTDTLLVLIDDILDLSKIEANQLTIEKSDIKLYEFIIEISKSFKLRKHSNFEFRMNYRLENKNMVMTTDPTRLRQILINLLDNSFKFTDKGYVELGVLKQKNTINFYVEDTGIGMSDIIMDRIFERFYKMDKTTEKIYRGTGLGLTISKKLVQLLGGEIQVKSKEGQGSRFDILLPYDQ